MKQLFLFGYYGFRNIGDDSVLYALLEDLVARGEYRFLIASDDVKQTQELYARFSVRAVPWDDYAALNLAIRQSDLLVIGGGGLYNCWLDYPPALFLRGGHRFFSVVTFGLPYLAELWGTPCMACGVGASEIRSEEAKAHIGGGLCKCAAVTARDRASQRILNSLPGAKGVKIQTGADPVFRLTTDENGDSGLPDATREKLRSLKRPILGVSLRNWSFRGDMNTLVESVAYAINAFYLRKQGSVVFLPFDNGGAVKELSEDAKVFAGVMKRIIPEVSYVLPDYMEPRSALALIGKCDLAICMRFHPTVMALNRGIPLVALAYEEKVWSAMASCHMEAWCIDVKDLTPELLSDKLARLAENADRIRSSIAKYSDRCRQSARLHADQIAELLEKAVPTQKRLDPVTEMLRDNLLRNLEREWMEAEQKAFSAGDYEKALSLLTLKADETNAARLYEKGFCLHQLGWYGEAAGSYQNALDAGFDEFWVRYNRGQLYRDAGDYEPALADLRRALELNEEHRETVGSLIEEIERTETG